MIERSVPRMNPLDDTDYETLNRVLGVCSDLKELLAACDGCSMETKEALERANAHQRFCEQVKLHFFPHRP